jgi:topoisomerase-4 subunit A
VPAASLCDLAGKHIVAALSCPPGTGLLIASNAGFGFVCEMSDLVSRQKVGKAFATVEDGHSLLPPVPLPADYLVKKTASEEEAAADSPASGHEIALQADDLRLLVIPLEQIKALTGGKGVTLIALDDKQYMNSAQRVGKDIQVNALNAKGKLKRVTLQARELDPYRGKRARKGRIVKV